MRRAYLPVPQATDRAMLHVEHALELFDPADVDCFWHREALERAWQHLEQLALVAQSPD
jgi:hypothetical protein